MRHIPGVKLVERERMGARCGELLAPGLGWAASAAPVGGWAAAAVAEAAAELPSVEPCPRESTKFQWQYD